jgi:hypothetical protein
MHARNLFKKSTLVYGASFVAAVALGIGGSAIPASAVSSDQSEAEGSMLNGTVLGASLDNIAGLAPAYQANTSNPGEDVNPLGATALDNLTVTNGPGGTNLFGGQGIINVGAVGQYAKDEADGTATASSGAIGSDGAIVTGTAGDTSNASVDADSLLSSVPGATGLISELRVELGALSAEASKTAAGTLTHDYQIAGGRVVLTSPAIQTLTADLTTTLGTLSNSINALANPGGTFDASLGAIGATVVTPLTTAINNLGLGVVTLAPPTLTATLNVDLASALTSVTATPLVSTDGITTIDLANGQIIIDLAELHGNGDHTLNNLPANTELLSGAAIRLALNNSIQSALSQIPGKITTAVTTLVNNATLNLHLTAAATVLGLPAGTVDAQIAGPVGGFLGLPGANAPIVDASGTNIAGIPVGQLAAPIVDTVTSTLLPAVVGPLGAAIQTIDVGAAIQPIVTTATTALDPLLDTLNDVVSITANVQESDGTFVTASADPTGSFSERALSVRLLGGTVAEVNLASATVRAAAIGGTTTPGTTTPGTTTPGTTTAGTTTAGTTTAGTATTTPGTTAASGRLPFTGADSLWLVPIALLILATGGTLLVVQRKRKLGL